VTGKKKVVIMMGIFIEGGKKKRKIIAKT